jgi:hypothetical protein
MNTPTLEEILYCNTDIQVPIRVLNGDGIYVGIGTVSLNKKDKSVLDINFEQRVNIEFSKTEDETDGNKSHEKIVPVNGTYKLNCTEQFKLPVIITATNEELKLRSGETTIEIHWSSPMFSDHIKSILSRYK